MLTFMVTKSISIQRSLTGYISKGIALCGKMQFQDAMQAFDLAFMFTNSDSKTIHFILLIKAGQFFLAYLLLHHDFQAITLFVANRQEEAMQRVKGLADACPNADT